jgi:hypothetical protein
MLKNLFKTLVLVLVAMLMLAVAGCSAAPASIRQALATAIAAPTDIPAPAPTAAPTVAPAAATPAAKAPTQPRATAPAAANNPLAQLRRLGLEGGVVAANNGNSLSLKLGRTTDQLQIAPTTLLVVPGIKNAQTSDVQVGDRVIANVPNSATNAIPSLVLDFPKGYTTDNVMAGLVQVNAKGTVMLRTRNGPQDIVPTDSTVIVSMLGNQPVLGATKDMARGNAAIVIGQKNGDQFSPQVIVILDRAALQGNGRQNQPTPTPTP